MHLSTFSIPIKVQPSISPNTHRFCFAPSSLPSLIPSTFTSLAAHTWPDCSASSWSHLFDSNSFCKFPFFAHWVNHLEYLNLEPLKWGSSVLSSRYEPLTGQSGPMSLGYLEHFWGHQAALGRVSWPSQAVDLSVALLVSASPTVLASSLEVLPIWDMISFEHNSPLSQAWTGTWRYFPRCQTW